MLFVGIDPGITGALAIYYGDTGLMRVYDTPVLTIGGAKKDTRVMDLQGCVALLRPCAQVATHVCMERVSAMPGKVAGGGRVSMGATSAFNFGQGYGMWQGILAALGLSYELVTPQAWKKSMMAGAGKEKDAARARAMELWPLMSGDLRRIKDHGRAEAALIAEYGRRHYMIGDSFVTSVAF